MIDPIIELLLNLTVVLTDPFKPCDKIIILLKV